MSNTHDQYTERDDAYAGSGNHRSLVANGMRLNFFGATAMKEQWRGNILPPFDVSLIRDPKDTEAYINSVGPCWTDVPDDTRFFLPASWSRKFLCYTFLGDSNTHFLSPRIRKNLVINRELTDMDLADAFDDIRYFIKNSKALTEGQRKALTERQRSGDRFIDSPAPQASFRHLLFTEYWSLQHQTPKVELQAITASAYKHLLDQMRWLVDDRNPSIGSTCQRYLLGDALSEPEGALVWHSTKRVVGEFGEANVMAFTPRLQSAAGAERRRISPEALRSRFLLTDEDNWNIPSYQEMVDFAVAELVGPNKIPLEIVKQACGQKADVGNPPVSYANAVQPGFDPQAQNYDPMAAAAQNRYAPASAPMPTSAPSAVVPTTAVPAMAAEPSYLVGVPGAPAALTPVSALPGVLVQTPSAMVQMPDGSWLPLASSGLVYVAPPAVSVPTVPVSVQTVPVSVQTVPVSAPVSAPATVPAASPVTTSAAPTQSVDDLRRKICPDERYARLTPAGLAEVNAVAETLLAHSLAGTSIPAAEMHRVGVVSRPDYLG